MVADSYFDKHLAEHGGLDYRSHDVDRLARFARECENVDLLSNNSLTTRCGTNGIADTAKGGGGICAFSYQLNGTRYEKLVTIDDELYYKSVGYFGITYTGAATSVIFQILPEDNSGVQTYVASLIEDGVETYSLDLGNGIDEAATVTVATLISGINALTDYACSLTSGTSTVPAAFIGPYQEAISTTLSVPFGYWSQFFCPTTSPFTDFAATFLTDSFQLADLQPHANRLFITTGWNELYKCDSVSVFRAGMPAATTLALGSASAGALTGTYYWQITYEQTDALDNYVEGDLSNEVTAALSSQQQALTIPQIQTGSEFLTSCTTVNGDQTASNILVASSTNFRAGMTVALYNRTVSAQFVELRKVSSVPDATHITLDASVHVHNSDVISAGLVINLWRNAAGGSEKSLVASFPNDSASATVSYTDNTADSSLSAEYEPPYEGHGLPPDNLKYLTVYQNLLIGSDGSDVVSFSDTDGPEYWNLNLSVRSKTNDPVRGIGANKEMLLIQKDTESHVVIGDLPGGNYRQERVTDAIGTDSHHSIVDVEGMLVSYSHSHGLRAFVGVNQPKDVSYRIVPVFTIEPMSSEFAFVHKRAICQYFPRAHRLLLFLPKEDSKYLASLESSMVFAADVSAIDQNEVEYDQEGRVKASFPKVKWFRWTGLDMSGGACIYEDILHLGMRHTSTATGSEEFPVARYLEDFDEYNYADFGKEYDWRYEAGWSHGGMPDLLKKFNRAVLYSFPLFATASFTVTAELEAGFINDSVRSSKYIVFGAGSSGTGWAYYGWGLDAFGDAGSVVEYFPFRPLISTAAKLVFSSTVFLTCPLISGWTIEQVQAFRSAVKEGV